MLAGRRGDRKAGLRSPVVGILLLGRRCRAGGAGRRQGAGELLIAAAAVVSVFGMIFLVPLVVVGVARIGRRFPLPLRYAVRDAARHRTRTVPAVAAVAATVAGVVALAIGYTSDQAQAEADYRPMLSNGQGFVVINQPDADWSAAAAAVSRVADTARVGQVHGIVDRAAFGVHLPGPRAAPADTTSAFPTQALVSGGGDDGVRPCSRRSSRPASRPGCGVLWPGGAQWSSPRGRSPATTVRIDAGTAPATGACRLRVRGQHDGADRGDHAAGTGPSPRGPVVDRRAGAVRHSADAAQESDLRQVLSGVDRASYLYVERGYQTPNAGADRAVDPVRAGRGADARGHADRDLPGPVRRAARPGHALGHRGSHPATRRGVAAAYALSVGWPALARRRRRVRPGHRDLASPSPGATLPGARRHYLEHPVAAISALVVSLPLVTALVVGLPGPLPAAAGGPPGLTLTLCALAYKHGLGRRS